MKRFTRKQITTLIFKARDAFKLLGARAAARGEAWDNSAAAFDAWRHEQVKAAVGKSGLSACVNNDYSAVKAHFEQLAGNDGVAFEHQLRAQTEKRRQLEHELAQAMNVGGFSPAYVQKICSDEYRCSVEDATALQLTRLVITVKMRARQRAQKSSAAHLNPSAESAPGGRAPSAPVRPACRGCGGRGSILDPDPYADRRTMVTCSRCGGTGKEAA